MTDYTPIDCEIYSRYEVAILHGSRLRLSWHDADGQTHIEVLRPRDLRTRAHAEFLIAEGADGTPLELRLDYITRMEEI